MHVPSKRRKKTHPKPDDTKPSTEPFPFPSIRELGLVSHYRAPLKKPGEDQYEKQEEKIRARLAAHDETTFVAALPEAEKARLRALVNEHGKIVGYGSKPTFVLRDFHMHEYSVETFQAEYKLDVDPETPSVLDVLRASLLLFHENPLIL